MKAATFGWRTLVTADASLRGSTALRSDPIYIYIYVCVYIYIYIYIYIYVCRGARPSVCLDRLTRGAQVPQILSYILPCGCLTRTFSTDIVHVAATTMHETTKLDHGKMRHLCSSFPDSDPGEPDPGVIHIYIYIYIYTCISLSLYIYIYVVYNYSMSDDINLDSIILCVLWILDRVGDVGGP